MLLLFAFAHAADTTALLPLTTDPQVPDHPVRIGLSTTAAAGASTDVGLAGSAELGIASRVAVGLRAEAHLEEDEPELGGGLRVEILEPETAPLALSAAVRYQREGFSGGAGEIEGVLAASRAFGGTTLYTNLVAGRELEEPAGDVELSVASLSAVGERVRVGADARGRLGLGEEAEREGRKGELAALGVAELSAGRWAVGAHAGAAWIQEEDAAVQGLVGLGGQLSF